MTHVYDINKDGARWPKWWEEDFDPDEFGTVCAICLRDVHHLQNSMSAPGHDWDAGEGDNYGSGFCVCLTCWAKWGRRPSYTNIDRHDRSVLQRFDAVYRRLKAEIKNGRGRTEGWRSIGALQSGWAHYGHHQ